MRHRGLIAHRARVLAVAAITLAVSWATHRWLSVGGGLVPSARAEDATACRAQGCTLDAHTGRCGCPGVRPRPSPRPGPSPRPAMVGSNITWVKIPGGRFDMGSNKGDFREQPVHRVTVPRFELAKSEVTVAQYRRCVEAGRCTTPDTGDSCNWGQAGRDNHPVNCVDWHQAAAFALWAGGRLPTEAEWEYAARSGGRAWVFPWGSERATCARAVLDDDRGTGCGRDGTWPVCSKTAGNTTHGLCDMAGNIWEWVQDRYHGNYRGAPTDGSAWEFPAGGKRVHRGGSFFHHAWNLRASNRFGFRPTFRDDFLGFRVARSIP